MFFEVLFTGLFGSVLKFPPRLLPVGSVAVADPLGSARIIRPDPGPQHCLKALNRKSDKPFSIEINSML
jgi:hypothetical protein